MLNERSPYQLQKTRKRKERKEIVVKNLIFLAKVFAMIVCSGAAELGFLAMREFPDMMSSA